MHADQLFILYSENNKIYTGIAMHADQPLIMIQIIANVI